MTPKRSQVNDRIFGSRREDQDRTSETLFIKLQGCIHTSKTGDEGKHDKTRRYSSTLERQTRQASTVARGLWTSKSNLMGLKMGKGMCPVAGRACQVAGVD